MKYEELGDLKLAGKVKGLDNAIASKEETQVMHGKKKGKITYKRMKANVKTSPNFMMTTGGAKVMRPIEYARSKTKLRKQLNKLTPDALSNVEKQLSGLNEIVSNKDLGLGLIGASIILLADKEGKNAKISLIDPAHMAVEKESVGIESFSNSKQVKLYQESNKVAVESILEVVQEVQKRKSSAR